MLQEQIRSIRQKTGMSLEELANAVYYTPHGLSQIETGKRGLKVDLFENLLQAMNHETLICEKGKYLEHSSAILEKSLNEHILMNVHYLQEHLFVKISCVQFSYCSQYDEIDVFFLDENNEIIDLEDETIYKEISCANYFIYDFLPDKFYPYEHLLFKMEWQNQKFDVNKF